MTLERLSALDAAFVALETQRAPMHVGWAALFSPPAGGPTPSFEAVLAHVESRLDRAPRYRQKLVPVPLGVGDPVWADDEDFDIRRHVRPAESDDLGRLVDEVMSTPLDHAGPLWELWIAERLDDGNVGVVGKAHHCLVDGLAAVELMALLLDLTPEPQESAPKRWAPAAAPSPSELLGDAVGDAVGRALDLGRLPFEYARSPRKVLGLPAQAWRSGRALWHMALPAAPLAALRGPSSSRRHLACRSRPLEDLKTIRRRFGTTINDVLLAASAGALRRLLHDRGEPPARVKAMVPVSVADTENGWGNRIAFLFVELPCDEADRLRRLREVHVAMRDQKQHGEPEGAKIVLDALSYAPRPLRSVVSRELAGPRVSNLTISNIPAPEAPLYLLGCKAERAFPVVPLTDGHGISIGMATVGGQACVGVYADARLTREADRLVRGIDESIDELLAHCRVRPPDREAGASELKSRPGSAPAA